MDNSSKSLYETEQRIKESIKEKTEILENKISTLDKNVEKILEKLAA